MVKLLPKMHFQASAQLPSLCHHTTKNHNVSWLVVRTWQEFCHHLSALPAQLQSDQLCSLKLQHPTLNLKALLNALNVQLWYRYSKLRHVQSGCSRFEKALAHTDLHFRHLLSQAHKKLSNLPHSKSTYQYRYQYQHKKEAYYLN